MIHRKGWCGAAIGLGLGAAVVVGLAIAQDLDEDGLIVSEEMLVEDAVNGALDEGSNAVVNEDVVDVDNFLAADMGIEDDAPVEPMVEPGTEAVGVDAELDALLATDEVDVAVDAAQADEEALDLASDDLEVFEAAVQALVEPDAKTSDQAVTNLDAGSDLDMMVEGVIPEALAEEVPESPVADLDMAEAELEPEVDVAVVEPAPEVDMTEAELEPEVDVAVVEPAPEVDMAEVELVPEVDVAVVEPAPEVDMTEVELEPEVDVAVVEPEPELDAGLAEVPDAQPVADEVVVADDEPLPVLVGTEEPLEELLVEDIGEPVAPVEEMVDIIEEDPEEAPVAQIVADWPNEAVIATPVALEPPVVPEPVMAERTAESGAETARAGKLDVMNKQEELRRQALDAHGREVLREAEISAGSRDFKEAERQFEEALRYIADRPDAVETRNRIRAGMAANYFEWAKSMQRKQEIEVARGLAQRALGLKHPGAERLIEELKRTPIVPIEPSTAVPRRRDQQQDFIEKQAQIKELLRSGRQHLINGELDRAQGKFEAVLQPSLDPQNTEAIRMIQKVAQKRYDRAAMELEGTRRDMMTEVRKAWNPRDYGLSEATAQKVSDLVPKRQGGDDQAKAIRQKLKSIKVPSIDFRQANIHDVVDFLQSASVDFDDSDAPPEEKGVNIILNLGNTDASEAVAPVTTSADPFADMLDAGGGAAGSGGVPLITFSARYMTLMEALTTLTSVANLKYRIEGSIVMIVPFNHPDGDIVVRMYDVLPAVEEKIRVVKEEVGAGSSLRETGPFISIEPTAINSGDADWKTFFQDMGVQWPNRSSIKYVRTIGKIVVANTEKNLAIFEQVLEVLNVVPSQIEIEARFVEVTQTDLDSLGFEWLMNDSWQLAQKAGQANVPAAARQRIELSAGQNGSLSGGTRFMPDGLGANATALDSVLKISSVLTNPELSMVLHMLEQRGHADLLSAPKVTTKSGNEAQIKVVTEYIYPTEFAVTPITAQQDGIATIVGGVVEPSTFETREVGVILSVLPEVSTEGQMINLNMTPEVVSEPTWYEYGSKFTDANGNEQVLAMPQPFFHTRSINTSISIYNGATVVMGGMITEVRNDVEDKIPFLGDLPLIGRLFRSSYERSEKRNLLIFVTARLVDPNGLPIKKPEEMPGVTPPEVSN